MRRPSLICGPHEHISLERSLWVPTLRKPLSPGDGLCKTGTSIRVCEYPHTCKVDRPLPVPVSGFDQVLWRTRLACHRTLGTESFLPAD